MLNQQGSLPSRYPSTVLRGEALRSEMLVGSNNQLCAGAGTSLHLAAGSLLAPHSSVSFAPGPSMAPPSMVPLSDLQTASIVPQLSFPSNSGVPGASTPLQPVGGIPPVLVPMSPASTNPLSCSQDFRQAADATTTLQAQESLLSLLLSDANFVASIQGQSPHDAALAAVNVVKQNLKAFNTVLRPIALGSAVQRQMVPQPSPRNPNVQVNAGSGHGDVSWAPAKPPDVLGSLKRVVDLNTKEFKENDRVVVASVNKKMGQAPLGKEGIIMHMGQNGWIRVHIPALDKIMDIQQRYLMHLQAKTSEQNTPNSIKGTSRDAAQEFAAELAKHPALPKNGHTSTATDASPSLRPNSSSSNHASAAANNELVTPGAPIAPSTGSGEKLNRSDKSRSSTKMKDTVRAIRKDLAALEHTIPWSAVDAKWRTSRSKWGRAVKSSETVKDLAAHINTLHESLMTNKEAGLFMHGGPWERSLSLCMSGTGPHQLLRQCWDDMTFELAAWLKDGQSGNDKSCPDLASYKRAAKVFKELQCAAECGPEALRQVPLEVVLRDSKDTCTALQSLLDASYKHAAACLSALANGGAADANLLSDTDLVADTVLASLGLTSRDGVITLDSNGDGMNTDSDDGGEATDMSE